MLIFSDMIRGNVGKQAVIKLDACDPVHLHCLGGNLHHATRTALFHHFCKIAVQIIGFRRRVHSREMLLADVDTVSSDHAGFLSGCLQNRLDHVGGRCLSFGSGDTDHGQLAGRIAKPCCR